MDYVKTLLLAIVVILVALGHQTGHAHEGHDQGPTQSPDPAPVVDASVVRARAMLNAYLHDTSSLRAQFRSVLLDERGVPLTESSGQVMVKRPHRFRWEYQEPAPSLLLADGKRLWHFDAELEQAVVRDLSEIKGANLSNLLGGDGKIDDDFDVKGLYTAGDIDWVELVPLGQASDFTKIRLGFSEQKISLMELHDQLGQVTQFSLTDVETNADLADQLFVFEPPAGVEIVGAN